jgi:uncharacterized membrane protein SirB2
MNASLLQPIINEWCPLIPDIKTVSKASPKKRKLMYGILKHTHMTLILVAVLLFIVNFYWLKTGHKNAQKPVFKKILTHIHLTILLLGAGLIWLLQINPFAETGYWLLEKVIAFVFYLIMVKSALTENKPSKMQLISFIGALGWLAYIVKLAISKQAILLVG